MHLFQLLEDAVSIYGLALIVLAQVFWVTTFILIIRIGFRDKS